MIYRFTIISDEVDDFVREIQIDPEATFFDFHEAILKSVGYANDQMTSFFICDDDWEKGKEVTLEEMDDNPEIDSWVMKDTAISELVEDEKQKLLYVFDYITERCFFIELSEIITGKDMNGAKCTKKSGDAPKQTLSILLNINACRSERSKHHSYITFRMRNTDEKRMIRQIRFSFGRITDFLILLQHGIQQNTNGQPFHLTAFGDKTIQILFTEHSSRIRQKSQQSIQRLFHLPDSPLYIIRLMLQK